MLIAAGCALFCIQCSRFELDSGPCATGAVRFGCDCSDYYGVQVCHDGSFSPCSVACSGRTCCDPGFAPIYGVEGVDDAGFGVVSYGGCRPGPSGISSALCCPVSDDAGLSTVARELPDSGPCPLSCTGASDCAAGQACCGDPFSTSANARFCLPSPCAPQSSTACVTDVGCPDGEACGLPTPTISGPGEAPLFSVCEPAMAAVDAMTTDATQPATDAKSN